MTRALKHWFSALSIILLEVMTTENGCLLVYIFTWRWKEKGLSVDLLIPATVAGSQHLPSHGVGRRIANAAASEQRQRDSVVICEVLVSAFRGQGQNNLAEIHRVDLLVFLDARVSEVVEERYSWSKANPQNRLSGPHLDIIGELAVCTHQGNPSKKHAKDFSQLVSHWIKETDIRIRHGLFFGIFAELIQRSETTSKVKAPSISVRLG